MILKTVVFGPVRVMLLSSLLCFLATQGMPGGALWAQSPGEPDYKYPLLQEKDFELALKLLDGLAQGVALSDLAKENGVSEEYADALLLKVSTNQMASAEGWKEEDAEKFGKNVLFDSSEKKLYEKYKDKLTVALAKPTMAD